MADDTSAALQALIKQVTTLTDTVEQQSKRLDDLHKFNGRILDEKKDLERKQAAPAAKQPDPADPATDAKINRLVEAGLSRVGNEWRRDGKPAHIITREQARDPRAYQIAKLAAEMSGLAMQIESDGTDQHRRGRGEVDLSAQKVIFDRDNNRAFMRRDVLAKDRSQYRALRNQGIIVESFDTLNDLPDHIREQVEADNGNA